MKRQRSVCHVERSETSLNAISAPGERIDSEILRFAQNDNDALMDFLLCRFAASTLQRCNV
ncbi:MAG: hypothetical protein DME33_05965 [Verrucomicrobia bacterium]|nr:MAG: hypothetical protein DME33_05965 [Verrucomicrobiota bacterium]